MQDILTFIPLGGVGSVTRNMYVYQYQDQILLVDCGLGFADETMLGVDLLLPDITYLLKAVQNGKKIVGMLITHGHEDHMGALPFILPQLPDFPIFASPFTAALANGKLKEFGLNRQVQKVSFGDGQEVKIGAFAASFLRVTHSVPDTSHIVIKTPVGAIYHGSDYKFDLTPYDGQKTDFPRIAQAGREGVLALMTDCLGSERKGYTPSEEGLDLRFEEVMAATVGKCIITTYSSNINRLNQAIAAATRKHRKVCFIGRSLINTAETAKRMGLMHIPKAMEVRIDQLKHIKDQELLLLVAGSQGQENSAMTRIANGQHKEVKLTPRDTVIFSADTIPGNEVLVNELLDTIAKQGVKTYYSDITKEFHVSGHGSQQDMMLLLSLVHPKYVVPISGTYKHMVAYRDLARKQGYFDNTIFLGEAGQELLFSQQMARFGQRFPTKNVYVDEISGEEIESYVLRDRQKLSMEGIVVVMAEIDSSTGNLLELPEVVARGFSEGDTEELRRIVIKAVQNKFRVTTGRVTNWVFIRKMIGDICEKTIRDNLKREPLVLPVVIEV